MPNFLSCDNVYEIGPISNFPVLTRPGFAIYEIPGTETYDGSTRYSAYEAQQLGDHNLQFSPASKGIILNPIRTLQRMNPIWFTLQGHFIEALPPEIMAGGSADGATDGSALLMYDQTLSNGHCQTRLSSNFNLPQQPSFRLQLVRNLLPPEGMDPCTRQYQFTFGGGYLLQWGGPDVYLFANGQQIYHHAIATDAAQTAFINAVNYVWVIKNEMGNLVLRCDQLDAELTVRNLGVLPAAPYSLWADSGSYAVNVSPYAYPASGMIVTDPLQHWYNYANDQVVLTTYPPCQPAGCAVAVSIYDAPTPTSRRYQITLTGDGQHTPILQAFQPMFPPVYADPAESWSIITEWVTQAAVTLSAQPTQQSRVGAVLREATLELLPSLLVNGQTLWQWLNGRPVGEYALRVKAGVLFDDGSWAQVQRFTGQLTTDAGAAPVGELLSVTWNAHDRWERLHQTALLWAPCVAGLRVDQAISLIAQWGGIAAGQIDATPIPLILTEPAGDPTNLYGDYCQPTWYPANGTHADEFIQRIAEHYGALVAFDGDGRLQILPGINPTVVGSYSRQPGAPITAAVEYYQDHADRQECVNTVIVQGRDQYGTPLYAMMQDNASLTIPNSPLYIGYAVPEIIVDASLTTQAAVNYACAKHFANRKAGYPRRTLSTHGTDAWLRLPNEVVYFVNADGVTETVRLLQVTTEYPGHQHSYLVTMSGELLL